MRIFDIERNSFVDGPGIRTTVFFKGCNLDCAWCHNPESKSGRTDILFYSEKCIGCGRCKENCENHAILDIGSFDKRVCKDCRKCELLCPASAIKLSGRDMTVDEVMSEINKDKVFYENSGGGVTFSGGECMLQVDALLELLMACRKENIHTAVDTAGNVPFESFEKIMPYTDLFLYDIKIIEKEKHKKYTGVDNTQILENLKELLQLKKSVWIRIPVIKGINDSVDEMLLIKRFLSPYRVERIELIPYHRLGESKYEAMGIDYIKFESPDNMEKLREVFMKE